MLQKSGLRRERCIPQLTMWRKMFTVQFQRGGQPSQNTTDTTNTECDHKRTLPETKTDRKSNTSSIVWNFNSNLSALICKTSCGLLWLLSGTRVNGSLKMNYGREFYEGTIENCVVGVPNIREWYISWHIFTWVGSLYRALITFHLKGNRF